MQRGHRVIAFGVVVLLVASAFASVAAADSAIGFRKADVSATTVTVGENITVGAEAVNVGDSQGGYTFEFEYDRTIAFDEIRVTIPANSDRRVTSNISFDEPGTYRISVNDKKAGIVTVQRARARVASANESQRRIDVRANGVSATESTDFDIPSSNRTFALRNWTTTTGQSAFQQHLTEYTDRSAVPGTLPAPDQSTLLGVVDFESEDGVEESTMRIAVNDSVLANSTLERDEVTVYQRSGTTWEPLSTRVASEAATRTVYEATATRGTTYAVGRMNASISIENTSVQTSRTQSGQLLILTGELRNSGPVPGAFLGALRVNGDAVNQTSAMVPANGTTAISLSHEVTEAGTYSVRVNSSERTTIIIADSQVGPSEPGGSPPGSPAGTGASTVTDTSAGDDSGSFENPLPSTVFGINTLYLVGGVAIALGAFVVIFLLLRRGGDGGGGRPDTFDPF